MPAIRCPHCDSQSTARTSRGVTPTYREIYYTCSRLECGHVWVAALSVLRTISPAAFPNPKVHIRYSPQAFQRGAPRPANDDEAEAVEGQMA